jgi:ketosteroid isomerase-like protein
VSDSRDDRTRHPTPWTTIADELAVRTLTASYTDAINRGDLADIARVYDADAVFTMMDRPSVVGRDAIIDVLRTTLARYRLVMQLLHSGVVQLDGDRARARWQITEFQVINDGERRFVAGRYEDELVRRDHGWQFTRRTFTARYLGDVALSSDVRPDAPPLFPLWPEN